MERQLRAAAIAREEAGGAVGGVHSDVKGYRKSAYEQRIDTLMDYLSAATLAYTAGLDGAMGGGGGGRSRGPGGTSAYGHPLSLPVMKRQFAAFLPADVVHDAYVKKTDECMMMFQKTEIFINY